MKSPIALPDGVPTEDGTRVLLYVIRERAAFRLEVARELNMCIEDVTEVLKKLEGAGLVRHDELDPDTHGGIYTPTREGIELSERQA